MSVDHLIGRDAVLSTLRAELVGPDPRGPELDFSKEISFSTAKESYGPFTQAGSGEEVLQRDPPTRRYGVGVLFPASSPQPEDLEPADTPPEELGASTPPGEPELVSSSFKKKVEKDAERVSNAAAAEGGDDDFDLAGANEYRPSVMAVTFLADLSAADELVVEINGGRYEPRTVKVEDTEYLWWLRKPVSLLVRVPASALTPGRTRIPEPAEVQGIGNLALEPFCVVRRPSGGRALVTVGLANRTRSQESNSASLFQTALTVRLTDSDGSGLILPYPEASVVDRDEEEQSIDLLFRDYPTFAIGHGCAADWNHAEGVGHIAEVRCVSLPSYETPSITSDIPRSDGDPLVVPMAPLAGLVEESDGRRSLLEVVDGYESWIHARERDLANLPTDFQAAAKRHLADCHLMLTRMRGGLEFLDSDPLAARAFMLANEAILLQQIRAGAKLRRLEFDAKAKRLLLSEPIGRPDPLRPPGGRGNWRPFQIAFLLAAIESTVKPEHEDRELVDLIFFPTGGGKTEAYLGLSAFSIFYRRLADPTDAGTQILMRYTLRLLTAQQFQRASSLICAMELMRRGQEAELGKVPFRIGIWVGGDTTPNTSSDAKRILKDLIKGERFADNKFILIRCPWCSAQIGPIKYPGNPPKLAPNVVGYEQAGSTVVFNCSDQECPFSESLPVVVIDDQIYELRPDLVIGTVDKFARLAWTESSRALFGLDARGESICSPPGLIIQDELHLISGPLGSMVGLYEAVIEDLCTRRLPGQADARPKIVSSTATIRRYQEQVRSLFARERTALFPPRGLDVADSYFAQYARDANGTLLPGRLYIGVHGSGLGSMQTAQVRTFSGLLQGAADLPEGDSQDPWWTLMAFFNSLRELGTSLSLLQSDIPDYLKAMKYRSGREWSELRRLHEPLELTGRLRSDEVPAAIASLEVATTDDGYPVDVCLASNIIEVGIDIDRLSLITIVGQPKTTSQYIQVSGRVGRRWWERPGLVVTIYGASKPRDRSHFERFRSYHERLYAQVEPTSVTPFSPPVLDRALHAVLISYTRQRGDAGVVTSPYPIPRGLLAEAEQIMRERADLVDPEERESLLRVLELRLRQWEKWEKMAWRRSADELESFLMRESGAYVEPRFRKTSWAVPTSLRNVDAECEAVVTALYAIEAADESEGKTNHA